MMQTPSEAALQRSDAAVRELLEGEAGIASHEVPSTARQIATGVIAVAAMAAAFFTVVYMVAHVVEFLFPLWGFGVFVTLWNL